MKDTNNQHANLNPQDSNYREAVVTSEEQSYDGGGWAGDGSGTDDFADYNANEVGDYDSE